MYGMIPTSGDSAMTELSEDVYRIMKLISYLDFVMILQWEDILGEKDQLQTFRIVVFICQTFSKMLTILSTM